MSKSEIFGHPAEMGDGPFREVFAVIHKVVTDPNSSITLKDMVEFSVSVSLTVCANLRMQFGRDPNCPDLQGFALVIARELMEAAEQSSESVDARIKHDAGSLQ